MEIKIFKKNYFAIFWITTMKTVKIVDYLANMIIK